MKNNKKASSIILAMWLVMVMSLLVLYILEYIIPYSKNVKWIENATNAFYQAESSIEDGLKYIKDRQIDVDISWDSTKLKTETGSIFHSNKIATKYFTTSSWAIVPPIWEWNSPYDPDFNIISPWNSIQLEIWSNMVNLSNAIFTFKIPAKLNTSSSDLFWWTWAIINWQLSSNSNTLNAKRSWILADDIRASWLNKEIFNWTESNSNSIYFNEWLDLYWSGVTIKDFYEWWGGFPGHCWSWSWCILKMFIVNELILDNTNKTKLPFLEYKINFGTNIPLRYSRIKSTWKSYWFQKKLEVRVPQQTINEAFGFTVIQ